MPFTPMSDFPVNDTRNVTDDRIQEDERQTPMPQATSSALQSNVYVTTADGDVETLIVDPSLDGTENAGKEHHREASWQDVRATEMGKTGPPERSSPQKDGKPASHARNLSAHFFDAATIKDNTSELCAAPGVSFDDQSQRSGYPTQHSSSSTSGVPPVSPAVGQKHSRAYSGDMSNPVYAHRRINSIGNGAQIDRNTGNPYYHSYAPIVKGRHHREGSAGLDMLTAAIKAADVPKEELAKAAGVPTSPIQNPADPPTYEALHEEDRSPPENATAMRTSPNESGNVHYGYPQVGVMGAPQVRHPQVAQPGYQQGPPFPPQPGFYPGQSFYVPGAPSSYGLPPGYHDGRQMRQGQPMGGYPMQYAPPTGEPHYSKAPFAPPPPTMETSSSSADAEMHHAGNSGNMPYQEAPVQWGGPPRPGTSTGVQTFVTTMAVGDGNKTMHVSSYKRNSPSNDPAIPSTVGHHRKLSSFSSLSTIFQEGDQVAMLKSGQGSSYFQNPTDQISRPAGPPPTSSGPPAGAHHRSMSSSMSFLNSLDEKTVRGHHRSTSSSVSFLQGLDNLDPNEVFNSGQQNPLLHAGPNTSKTNPYSPGNKANYPNMQYGGPPRSADPPSSTTCVPITRQASAPAPPPADKSSSGRLAAGGTSKRVRRKCTVEGCPNRVVQGGLCISHGAKRKQCKHPGCTKNVKKAGLCSTHGPARKRCDAEGCQKVAVQGGRCIAHGAKKKLCDVEGCKKQAILSGMCKKHHDQNFGAGSGRRGSDSSARDPSPPLVASAPPPAAASSRKGKRPSHTRGLSIFQEVSPENIQNLLSGPESEDQNGQGGQPDAFGRM